MTMPTLDVYRDQPPSLRVGLCQVLTERWQVDANLERTLAALREAKAKGADLAITPECVLHGYPVPGEHGDYRQRMRAEPLDGPRLGRVRAEARQLGLDVVFGFEEQGADGRMHNSAAYIGRDGDLRFVYRKVHLRFFESAHGEGHFTPGERFFVEERAWGERRFRIGAMICFDREIPETNRCLRALGAEFVACPLATDTSRLDQWQSRAENEMVTRVRAAENECFIAVVNHAGRFNGGSFVAGPYGDVWCQLGAEPEVRMVELPIGAVRGRFHSQPLGWMGWGYRRPEVYEKYLGKAAAKG